MLRGIDISSHQDGIQLPQLQGVDFVICKATEGLGYVWNNCDSYFQQARKLGKLVGFYHYGRQNAAKTEAEYFIDNCFNYFGVGIPILDWEDDQSVQWVNLFVNHVHNETGIWCWIYANPWRFNQGVVEPNCARWIADYPPVEKPGIDYDPGEPPNTNGLVSCWQYASDGNVAGYNGNLDVNLFYGDRNAWLRYVGGRPPQDQPLPGFETLENDTYKVTIERKEI